MLRATACVLVLLIVTIAATDPIYCADGCGRTGLAATQTPQTGADCPTCLGASMPQIKTFAAGLIVVGTLSDRAATSPALIVLTAIEHPPRPTA